MNLESIADHVHRIVITPHNRIQRDGTQAMEWQCTIDLRFDPPHHFAAGYGSTLEEAIERAVERAVAHIAIARG